MVNQHLKNFFSLLPITLRISIIYNKKSKIIKIFIVQEILIQDNKQSY